MLFGSLPPTNPPNPWNATPEDWEQYYRDEQKRLQTEFRTELIALAFIFGCLIAGGLILFIRIVV